MYSKLIILVVVISITSCSGGQLNDSNSDSNNQAQTNANFIISNFEEAYFTPSTYKTGRISFRTTFEIKNNTNDKITFFYLNAFIRIKNKDGWVWKPSECNGDYIPVPKVSSKNPWLPNTSLKYSFTIPQEDQGSVDCRISKIEVADFEKTPMGIVLTFEYEAISVDNEYRETLNYDILNQWKDYQSVLGLR